ncbi:hypothetical protein FRC04_005191 [Tulasnella sp. 424]|nr:hypothetical protein FRC04_005191 [Tulasnella sp. 424]KAG8960917.1 hypothetical protein FRC05_006528 [Tulasnella sp. 425]
MQKADKDTKAPVLEIDERCIVINPKTRAQREAIVLEKRGGEAYVHYINTDKRLDEWVSEDCIHRVPKSETDEVSGPNGEGQSGGTRSVIGKRRRSHSPSGSTSRPARHPNGISTTQATGLIPASPPPPQKSHDHLQSTKEQDVEAAMEHQRITAKRNFDKVIFGGWEMKTWYYSPYPIAEDGEAVPLSASSQPPASGKRSKEKERGGSTEGGLDSPAPVGPTPVMRTHGRTADLLASSSIGRTGGFGDQAKLWVCDRCFKYMREGISWELHMKKCDVKNPPGRKVYQRGAHTIWEVDGAEEKLFCQNLALYGKLFIDVKTIFFDCENFMFYLLTDADSQRDHVLGFFSKEKVSYDDWNLACIITFPPYQKKGYGMLLIEFSYELSRRAGKLGTPERPLSDLGLRGYLAYWVATLVRFFRRILGTEPEEDPNAPPGLGSGGHSRKSSLSASGKPTKRKIKGFDGEIDYPKEKDEGPSATLVEQPTFGSIRTTHTETTPNGTTRQHLNIRCTLMDIARATGLRHEDVAFAMEECGLLMRRKKEGNGQASSGNGGGGGGASGSNNAEGGAEEKEIIYVSAEMVEKVAKERRVKHRCILDPAHVLL